MPQEAPVQESPHPPQTGRAAPSRASLSMFESAWIWLAVAVLVLAWLPLLAAIRVFDRDPVRYRTGRWFRRLGATITRVNPAWDLQIQGAQQITDPRRPYVIVSNHQSMADIPLLSHLPWEMKWVAKLELFKLPVVGWMMRMAGDIPVNRTNARSGARAMITAAHYLDQHCSVMFFPEGTRSRDGRIGAFNDGAFHLAARQGVLILPIAVDGSHGCLPKKSWRFGGRSEIRVKVLPPIQPGGSGKTEATRLRDEARASIVQQLAQWRGVAAADVDALASPQEIRP